MFKLAAAVSVVALPHTAAEVTGKVSLKGTPLEKSDRGREGGRQLWQVAQGKPKPSIYMVGPDGGLANTIVYVKKGLD